HQPQPGPAAGDLRPRTRRVRPRARLGPERVTRQELKQRVHEAIERHAQAIIAVGEQIRRHPELGFKELRTAALVEAELRRLGLLDDVGLAMMIHTTPRPEDGPVSVPHSNNGRFGKTARFVGRAAHAGSAPHLGVNALYAAQIALAAINAVRETFRDDDTIRVHPILTHGGSQVNMIPGEARVETYVRG